METHMTHEMTSDDGLVITGRPAWHGIGVVVDEAPTVADALRLAGLDWTVEKVPLRIQAPGDVWEALPGYYALRRSDTGLVMACGVTDRYEPSSPAMLGRVVEALGDDVRLETAGSCRGGRDVYLLARTNTFSLGIGDGSEVCQYGLVAANNAGEGGVRFLGTDVVVVCANTLAAADGSAADIIRAPHTRALADVLSPERVAEAIAKVRRQNDRTRAVSEALADEALSQDALRDFWLAVFERAHGRLPVRIDTEADKAKHERAQDVVSQWLANHEGSRCRTGGLQGTAWAALQAVTEYADHGRSRVKDPVHSKLFGSGAALKAAAWGVAAGLVGAGAAQ